MIYSFFKSFVFSLFSTCLFACVIFLTKNLFQAENLVLLILVFFVLNVFSSFLYFYFFYQYFSSVESKKEHELKLLKTNEKYRREFLGNVSHELKTPIFNIQGYVETLIGGAIYDKAVNKKYLQRTNKSVDRLIYIIQDLETISQLESEELKLELTQWKLKNLISEIIEQFEIKAKQKTIKLIHDERSTNLLVYADKGKIHQVLSNLISNSIKYGKKGGSTMIRCHEQLEGGCQVSIKDNGIGIAQKNINRLFERFYRVDTSRSREQGGTGLGLAIVKHIIEAHGETVNVKSAPGKGTEFVFSINSSQSS